MVLQILPVPCYIPPGDEQEYAGDTNKIDHIADIDHAFADTGIMEFNAGHFGIIGHAARKHRQFADGIEPCKEQEAGKRPAQECHNGIGREAAGADTHCGENGAQQQQPGVAAGSAAGIEATSGAELLQGYRIEHGGCQCQRNDEQCPEKFAPYDLAGGEGHGFKQFKCAAFVFIGQAAHGDGGYQKQEYPWCQAEKPLQ